MKKLIIILVAIFASGIGFHIHRRYSADFFYVNGKIETHHNWSGHHHWRFNEERYKLLKNGFRVEKGNFLWYTEEVFESASYIHRLRIMGFPVKFRKVDYTNNYCWGFPGIPGIEWFKDWPSKGRKRFNECLPIIELYKKRSQKPNP